MLPATLVMTLANAPLAQQLALLFRMGMRELPTQDGKLNDYEGFHLWSHGLLMRLPFLNEQARDAIMTKLLNDSSITAELFKTQPYRIAISDKRFVNTESDPNTYLDTKTGETLTTLPEPPLEALIYDLSELFRRNAKHCTKAATNERGPDESMAGSVGKS